MMTIAEESENDNNTDEPSVRAQSGATTHSKMQALRIESFSSEESHHQQCESDDEEKPEGDVSSSEDGEVENANDSGQTVEEEEEEEEEENDDEAPAELNGSDEGSFTSDHFEDDEREKDEREWQPGPRGAGQPHGKWPTLKYTRFLRLRLPDLRERLVTVVPGIGAAAGVRLAKRGTDTVRC